MGTEQPASFYNRVYQDSETYLAAPVDSPWFPLWAAVAKRVRKTDSVFDIGCGPGHMAQMLQGRCRSYAGLDSSGVAIQQARARVPGVTFRWADAFEYDLPNVDLYLFLEVLEHVTDDLFLLGRVPVGKRVVITVPNHDSESHVRHFESLEKAVRRYELLLDLSHSERVGKNWFLIEGART